MKLERKSQAILLRKEGYLYSEIAKELGVSKSTAHLWTYHCKLTDQETQKIFANYSAARRNSIRKMTLANKKRREKHDQEIQARAKIIVQNIQLSSDYKRLLCACLFWCEGDKNLSAGVRFINSDPVLIQVFLKLLRESFAIDEKKLRALVHLHEYHKPEEQLKYWSEITQIPLSQFHKSYIKPRTGINKREGYPGCLALYYSDAALGKLLKMIYIEFSNNI